MKKLIYFIAVSLMIIACSKEDSLENNINFEDVFAIVDNPSDPVQHERYNIYKEYDVPVYFNDTIASKQVGVDYYGKPIIRYETVDLQWSFDSYDQNASYRFNFLAKEQDKLNSLKFIREYLEICNEPMRPFSVLLVDTLTVGTGEDISKPVYHVGYRTLVIAQVKDITSNDSIALVSKEIIQNMIKDKISADRNLCARFAAISSLQNWYFMIWDDSNAPTVTKWRARSWLLSPTYLFHGEPYKQDEGQDFVEIILDMGLVGSEEEAIAERNLMLQEIGNYGFIRSSNTSAAMSPASDEEDRDFFLRAMLYLGANKFTERYGEHPLIMEKYKILHDFITEELGLEL